MDFFKTAAGHIHVGRVAFVGYISFIVACLASGVDGRIGGGFITFAMGWWIAFCGKRPPHTWAEYSTSFRMRFGFGLFVMCVAQAVAGMWLLYYRGH